MQADSPVVYLVDDDDAVRDSLSLLLRSVGMNVKAFAHPAEFLAQFRGDELGCLVLDIRMPAISGLAVQERLVSTGCKLPIIMITGHGDVAQCRRAFQNGAVDFLTKPIDEQGLIDSLQKAIHVSREGRHAEQRVQKARARFDILTPRERKVCERVAEGLINKQIAEELSLSLRTVEAYRASAFEKLEVGSVAELVRMKLLTEYDRIQILPATGSSSLLEMAVNLKSGCNRALLRSRSDLGRSSGHGTVRSLAPH